MLTSGINELDVGVKTKIFYAIQSFDNFTKDNDPHGEHDFGSFDLAGVSYFFKIDLYEEPNVKDANGQPVGTRVLTIMLANEY